MFNVLSRSLRWTIGAALVFGAAVSPAAADEWNERTVLEFSEPVLIPGATLPAGRYEFRLMDVAPSRNTVQVTSEDGSEVFGIIQAIPAKREDARGDVVLKFNPTEPGTPPALKAWFYPGSLYGHEFVYPDAQAKEIAERTRTIVLSGDAPGTDLERGTLYTYDASGTRGEWRPDSETMTEWEAWQRNRQAHAKGVSETAPAEETRERTAPVIEGELQGTRVSIDDLEDDPQKYRGKTISVDAKVEEVLGPRLFTIDEDNWADFQGEILTFVPTHLAAVVREDDRVTITGTMQPFAKAEIEREWGFLGLDRETEIELSARPVLVASRIVGGDNQTAMLIEAERGESARPVGTTGSAGAQPIDDLATLARGDEDLVGRRVDLEGVRAESTAKRGGFFAQTSGGTVLILPAPTDDVVVNAGDTVSVEGVVLEMPSDMRRQLDSQAGAGLNDDIYVFATRTVK